MNRFLSNEMVSRLNIVQALRDLMSHQPLEKITVTEICQLANISRPTFYSYFTDKYEIPVWYFFLTAGKFVSSTEQNNTWEHINFQMLEAMKHDARFFSSIAKLPFDGEVRSRWRLRMEEDLMRTLKSTCGVSANDEIIIQVRATVRTEELTALDWLISGMQIEPARMSRIICSLLPPRIYSMFSTR